VPAVFRSLQLDDDQTPILVEAKQIDPSAAVLPLAELLRHDE
jgi:hypothetical protein